MTEKTSSRQAIVDAAAQLIRTRGVQGTSIAQLVATSGTSAGAIYHHFGSKERLVLEVGRTALVAPMAMMLQASVTLSPIDLLSAALVQVAGDERTPELLLQIWAGAKSDPDLYQLLQSEVAQVRLHMPHIAHASAQAGIAAAVRQPIGKVVVDANQ
mgnify:CR=1 FL=1